MSEPKAYVADPGLVNDRQSFFAFVQALIDDRIDAIEQKKLASSSSCSPDAEEWENVTIETYLGAALAWAKATNMGSSQGLPEEPSWRTLAVFLYVGKTYE